MLDIVAGTLGVIFLSESGYSPDERTTQYYLGQFHANKGCNPDEKKLKAFGGPTYNQGLQLVSLLRRQQDLLIAVFVNNNDCKLIPVDRRFISDFQAKACGNMSLSSWQIVMDMLKE